MIKAMREKLTKSNWLEYLEKFFFSLFILSIPLQTRLTYPTAETYINGAYNEYATFFLYLSDNLFLITLLMYFVNILTKSDKISLVRHKLSTSPQLIPILCILAFVAWSFLGVIWAQYYDIALYRSFKLLELFLLFIYIKQRFYWFGAFRLFVLIFITGIFQSIIGILQYFYQHSLGLKLLGESVLAPNINNVAKIIIDNDRVIRAYGTFPHPNVFAAFLILSIFSGIWLLLSFKSAWINIIVSRAPSIAIKQNNANYPKHGANNVSRETLLAKATEGETIMNELIANKLDYKKIKSIIFKLFHVRPSELLQYVRMAIKSISTKLFHVKQFYSERRRVKQSRYIETLYLCLLTAGIIIQLYALFVTFSRLAWVGFIITTFLIIFSNFNKLFYACPPQPPQFKRLSIQSILAKLFHVKQFINICLSSIQRTSLIIIVFSVVVISGFYWDVIINRVIDSGQAYEQSIDNRILYKHISASIINRNLILGVGNGNFTLVMDKYSEKPLEWWQYQPVHNIYLLIVSELGVVGLVFFILFSLSITLSIFYAIRNNINVLRLPAIASLPNNEVYFRQDNKIVSRVPFIAIKQNNANYPKHGANNVSRETLLAKATEGETFILRSILGSIFITYLLIGLFDHYFWSLQQGQLTFWFIAGVLSALNHSE